MHLKKDHTKKIGKRQLEKQASAEIAASSVNDGSTVLQNLLNRMSQQEESINSLYSENARLNRRIGYMEVKMTELKKENSHLKQRLSLYENESGDIGGDNVPPIQNAPKKDSHNSSIPPSKEDPKSTAVRRTRSLRKSSDKPVGGQPGHKGYTLEARKDVDKTRNIAPNFCPHCGRDLANVPGVVKETRQVVDIVLPSPFVTNYNIVEKVCECGHKVCGEFPDGVNAPVSYGPNLMCMVVFLVEAQHVPTGRVVDILKQWFGLSISEGTVCNFIKKIKNLAMPAYEEIRRRVSQASVAGADETGEDVCGKLWWLWAWQTKTLTLLHSDKSRGQKAIEKVFPEGLPKTTLVTDRLGAYFKMKVAYHQVCLAHLLRNLTYLSELDTKQTWSSRLKSLLEKAIHQRKSRKWENISRKRLYESLDKLLQESVDKLDREFGRLQRSLRGKRDAIFRFLEDPDVPYDNNSSEQAIRKTKIKMKVSQCFRSKGGAEAFAVIQSILDTAKKNSMSPYQALGAVWRYGFAVPE